MEPSPWGWYLPMTSPVTRAHFMYGRSERAPTSIIPYRIRRWTGFRPSRASGRARDTMTDMAYSRKERSISSWISTGSMPATTVSPSASGEMASSGTSPGGTSVICRGTSRPWRWW